MPDPIRWSHRPVAIVTEGQPLRDLFAAAETAGWVVVESAAGVHALRADEVAALRDAIEGSGLPARIRFDSVGAVLALDRETASTPVADDDDRVPGLVGERGSAAGRVVRLGSEPAVGGTDGGGSAADLLGALLSGLARFAAPPRMEPLGEETIKRNGGWRGARGPRAPGIGDAFDLPADDWDGGMMEVAGDGGDDDLREIDLGPMLGGGAEIFAPEAWDPEPPEPERVPAIFSGDAPTAARAGDVLDVRYRIERAGADAAPLREARAVDIAPDLPVRIVLATRGDVFELISDRTATVDPPTPGAPREGAFQVVVLHEAVDVGELSLIATQGGSHLGTLAFSVTIGAAAAPRAEQTVEMGDRGDDEDTLMWTVMQRATRDGTTVYEHHLNSDRGHALATSKPLRESGPGSEDTRTAYLEHLYKVLNSPVRTVKDLKALTRAIEGRAASLCDHLLDPDVTRQLWEFREDIEAIYVHSYDPLIPWELVKLRHPDTGQVDDKYLAEYGLVRWLTGLSQVAPRDLRLDRWRYLAAEYTYGVATPVAGEVAYFTGVLPAAGADVARIPADPDRLYEAVADPDVDVLHLACHGESNLHEIESARLLIADRRGAGGAAEPVYVDSVDLGAALRFDREAGPLVFLTACQGGKAAPSLTDWTGWPRAFLKAGASAFVGTSWSVLEKPAFAFSEAFYDALRAGETLAAAATAGRLAAKTVADPRGDLFDASWLAYKVYGHPKARRVP